MGREHGVTEAERAELVADCPTLFHMAESGAWPTIQRHGLLSTAAALDLFGASPETRAAAARRRPAGIVLEQAGLGRVVLRDQKPLSDAALARCLRDGLTPEAWRAHLNGRVFFWLSAKRLATLLAGRAYRDHAHEILELDTAALMATYRGRIELSPINSGATGRFPAPRGADTFLPIDAYPYAAWRAKRARGERAVELTVPGAVPDAAHFVTRVTLRQGPEEIAVLYARDA